MSVPPDCQRIGSCLIYWGDHSDIYDELERPSATLPDWDTGNDPEKIEAFLRWALDALDEFDPPGLNEALELMQSKYTSHLMFETWDEDKFEPMYKEACQSMPFLTREAFRKYRYGPVPKKPAVKRGSKPYEPIVGAVADWANLTTLFTRHWGKVQRKAAPTRKVILIERHKLTEDEWERAEVEIKKSRRRR